MKSILFIITVVSFIMYTLAFIDFAFLSKSTNAGIYVVILSQLLNSILMLKIYDARSNQKGDR